ncbi:hypothetical protein NON20_17700 [Synechocystis sp. B12]|nr:hypothetical protein NON20_17700 [Synechocystis sp. B12]
MALPGFSLEYFAPPWSSGALLPHSPRLFSSWLDHGLFFAQSVREVDILGDFQDAWNNFIKTGQVWALIIGFVLGWGFRGFTGG